MISKRTCFTSASRILECLPESMHDKRDGLLDHTLSAHRSERDTIDDDTRSPTETRTRHKPRTVRRDARRRTREERGRGEKLMWLGELRSARYTARHRMHHSCEHRRQAKKEHRTPNAPASFSAHLLVTVFFTSLEL